MGGKCTKSTKGKTEVTLITDGLESSEAPSSSGVFTHCDDSFTEAQRAPAAIFPLIFRLVVA